tara:strand:+ start:2573 stop:3196 length:624 start_codon:yes stop_codon:yes gene_type:complete
LPLDPPPGNGPLLLAGVVCRYLRQVDPDFHDDYFTILAKVQRGEKVGQPRLRHRLQKDKVGLARTRHRLSSVNGKYRFSFDDGDMAPEQNVLAAAYVIKRFSYSDRPAAMNLLRKAAKWNGDVGEEFLSYLLGQHKDYLGQIGHSDATSWALHTLEITNPSPSRNEIKQRFRELLRTAHPDTGDLKQNHDAAKRISDLTEARRVLLR